MTFRGIIFDMDGTLVDTLPDIASAVNEGRRALGLAPRPASDIQGWIGEGLPALCRRALNDAPDESAEEMVPIVSAYYAAHRLDASAPFPGIPELLDGLTARAVPVAILSNKPQEHTIPMTQALLGRWPFVAVEGSRDEDHRKPDPRTALQIVGTMHLPPDKVALVGDSDTDMRTALNAGCIPVGVTWGYRDRETIQRAGARHLVDDPAQILSLVG